MAPIEALRALMKACKDIYPMKHKEGGRWSHDCRLNQEDPRHVSFGSVNYPRPASAETISRWESTAGTCTCDAGPFNRAFEAAQAALENQS